jgi:glycosyltransferase involved in cell wall biosynthesis
MQSAGLDVEVFAYPEVYPDHAGVLGVPYAGIMSEVPAETTRRAHVSGSRLGSYWQFIGEPYLVLQAGCSHALKRKCDIVYIADVEPWLTLPLCVRLAVQRYPLPLVGQTPGNYAGYLKTPSLRGKIRLGLNYHAVRLLPRFMDVLGTSRHILGTLKLDGNLHAHVMPEGHEDRIGWRSAKDARDILGLPNDVRMILLFGVAGSGKRADILLQALEMLPPDFMVCIVGKTGGVYEASWGDVAGLRKAGWTEDRLHIVNRFVTEEEMQNYYAACDGVVIPYRSPFPGTSTHLRRATEHGKAIVACDQYHIAERVREYRLGLLFSPDDPAALAHQLHEFAQMPSSWFDQIRDNSRQLLAVESWENIGFKYRELFRSMVK